jgi:hypothetical protein
LVAFRVPSFDQFQYIGVLDYAVVDVQEQSFALYCVEFGYDALDLDVFQDVLGEVGEFVIGKLCYELEHLHFALGHRQPPEVS